MRNKTIGFLTILLSGIFFSVFFFKYNNLSYTVFKDRVLGENFSSIYYELFLGLASFIILTVILIATKKRKYTIIWLIKGGLITIFFMLFYEAKYGGDPTYYADEALKNNFLLPFGLNGTLNIIYINHIFTYVFGNSYYSLKVFNSFIGFLGLIFLYKTYEYIMQKTELKIDDRFIYIFFLFPSVLFWSSILGKDPLNLFFVGMFIYAFIHIIDEFKFRYLLMIFFSVWLVSYIRSWYAVIMVSSMFLYFLKVNSVRNFILFLIVLPVFAVMAQQFLQTQGITSVNLLFLKMTETTKNLSYGKSAVSTNVISSFGDYLLYYIPSLFTSLFRPMPWDIRNPFTAMAAVENVILFYLTFKYIFRYWRDIYRNKYLKFLILFIFSWSLLYVIISPANLGGAARFKLQVLPAMLILIGVAMAMSRQREERKDTATGSATVKSVI